VKPPAGPVYGAVAVNMGGLHLGKHERPPKKVKPAPPRRPKKPKKGTP
jgi:hypothetical protein